MENQLLVTNFVGTEITRHALNADVFARNLSTQQANSTLVLNLVVGDVYNYYRRVDLCGWLLSKHQDIRVFYVQGDFTSVSGVL